MTTVFLTIPVPPSLNNAYLSGKHGRRVLTAEGRSYKELVGHMVKALGIELAGKERFELAFTVWFPNNRRRDISNIVKLPEDAISEALGFDDCCVDQIYIRRAGIDRAQPRCEVELRIMSNNTIIQEGV